MLVACRLAGLSAMEAHYLGLVVLTQSRARQDLSGRRKCVRSSDDQPR
jgi:hypothetical protein